MSDDQATEPNGAIVTVDFIRHRNVLLVQGDLTPLFTDYYLHLADHHLRYTPEQDTIFKQALAAFALHCVSRPHGEHLAWTVNFQRPLLNLFLTGDNEDGTVAGRLFTENVREAEHNIFYSDIVARRGAPSRRSIVDFTGTDSFAVVGKYYEASEQRTARYFDLGEDAYAMLIAHPDCDEKWLRAVDQAGLRALAERETLAPIERRLCQWRCGCSHPKILSMIATAARGDMAGVLGDDESAHISCPRCAAQYVITREALEAYFAEGKKDRT
jgi:molecular chaperone Hsp33